MSCAVGILPTPRPRPSTRCRRKTTHARGSNSAREAAAPAPTAADQRTWNSPVGQWKVGWYPSRPCHAHTQPRRRFALKPGTEPPSAYPAAQVQHRHPPGEATASPTCGLRVRTNAREFFVRGRVPRRAGAVGLPEARVKNHSGRETNKRMELTEGQWNARGHPRPEEMIFGAVAPPTYQFTVSTAHCGAR